MLQYHSNINPYGSLLKKEKISYNYQQIRQSQNELCINKKKKKNNKYVNYKMMNKYLFIFVVYYLIVLVVVDQLVY